MTIQIPADLTIVTLQDAGGRPLLQRVTEAYARELLAQASDLLRSRADIIFRLGTFRQVTELMPAGVAADVVDDGGFHFLTGRHPAGLGVRVLLVDRFNRWELGGRALRENRVCAVAYISHLPAASRVLAHELGHLLGLPHIDEGRSHASAQESEVAAWMRNLMYSGLIHPDPELTPAQVRLARQSALARRFTVEETESRSTRPGGP